MELNKELDINLGTTWSLHKIHNIVKKINPNLIFNPYIRDIDNLYASGAQLRLHKDGEEPFFMSIQTHPSLIYDAFCETALIKNSKHLQDASLGYTNKTISHDEPEEFESHLKFVLNKLGLL